MNKKLLNTQIEALTREHGEEIVKFYTENGFEAANFLGVSHRSNDNIYRFYGVNNEGGFSNRERKQDPSIETITLEEAKALIESEYPKLMYVWDNEGQAYETWLVVGKFDKWFIAFDAAKIEDVQSDDIPAIWKHAKDIEDIEEQPIIELTLEEIAAKFGHKSSQIRIKE
jgi:hypothetical protein